MRAVAVESFTVVMATGIVAVAARDNGPSLVRCVFAAGGVCGLALIIVWLVVARIRTGRGIARGRNPIDRTFGLFGFVAATDVVAAQFDPMTAARTLLLVIALAAWVAVVTRLVAVLLASDIAALQADVRGGWLLAVVATQSLVLVAPHPAVSGGVSVLFVAAGVVWTASIVAYVLIAAAVVTRLLGARLAPAVLTADTWILMGAAAITVVAGVTLVEDPTSAGPPRSFTLTTIATCWLVATAWIPLLVAAEAWRARAGRPGFELSRWATVFPLGMYAVACTALGTVEPTARTILRDVSTVMFWIALAAWCATAIGMVVNVLRPAGHPREPGSRASGA